MTVRPPATMRAVVLPRHGGPEVLEVQERPRPAPLVKLHLENEYPRASVTTRLGKIRQAGSEQGIMDFNAENGTTFTFEAFPDSSFDADASQSIQKYGAQIDSKGLVPIFDTGLDHRRPPSPSCIVDQDIDGPERAATFSN